MNDSGFERLKADRKHISFSLDDAPALRHDLDKIQGLRSLSRCRLNARALPKLRSARDRFGRLPRCQALALIDDARVTDPARYLSPHHAVMAEIARGESAQIGEIAYAYRRMETQTV